MPKAKKRLNVTIKELLPIIISITLISISVAVKFIFIKSNTNTVTFGEVVNDSDLNINQEIKEVNSFSQLIFIIMLITGIIIGFYGAYKIYTHRKR